MPLNIIIADPHGFCFGVNRAVKLAQSTAKNNQKQIYLLGELVHNQHVIDWLQDDLKIKTVNSLDEITKGSVVIIRAHGASPEIFKRAKNLGLTVIDGTCPLVVKSHQIALDEIKNGRKVIFLCSSVSHDETLGIVGESPESVIPVSIKEIFKFKIEDPKKYTVLTQTTLSTLETKSALDYLKSTYPDLNIVPHICPATTERQQAIIDLAKKFKFVIIVGAPSSANSNNLRAVAESVGARAFIVDNASELNPDWFKDEDTVVVSSGASTPESVLLKVIEKIEVITRQ
jgi:4-hydroxy-3-methylbut-2-enyl diphosphate reductase